MYVGKQLPTFRASLFAPYWRSDCIHGLHSRIFDCFCPEDEGSQLLRNACNITNKREIIYQKTWSFFPLRSFSLKVVAQNKQRM